MHRTKAKAEKCPGKSILWHKLSEIGISESVAGIFREESSAVSDGGGLYRGGILQHWEFSAPKIFFQVKTFLHNQSRNSLNTNNRGYQKEMRLLGIA